MEELSDKPTVYLKQITLEAILLLGITYGSIVFLGYVFEIYNIITEPSQYRELFGLNSTALHWQFLSEKNLIIWDLGCTVLYGFYLYFNWQAFKKKKKYAIILTIIADIIVIILIIRYHVLLKESGYDHYPGFDPYFF